MSVFAFAPIELPEFKHKMLAIFSSLLCALFTFFFVGSLNVTIHIKNKWVKLVIQSGGGAAAFVLVLLWWNNPYFAPIKNKDWKTTIETIERTGRRTEELRNETEMLRGETKELRDELKHSKEITKLLLEQSDRQLQEVMAEYIQFPGKRVWHAPNTIYPGSVIKFYGFTCDLILRYGEKIETIRSGDGGSKPTEIVITGNSGHATNWNLENQNSEFCHGKVYVSSSPRIRSSERSWKEERRDKDSTVKRTQNPDETPEEFFKQVLSFSKANGDGLVPNSNLFKVSTPSKDDYIEANGKQIHKLLTFSISFNARDITAKNATLVSRLQGLFFPFMERQGFRFQRVDDRSAPGWDSKVYLFHALHGSDAIYVHYESEKNNAETMGYAKIHIGINGARQD